MKIEGKINLATCHPATEITNFESEDWKQFIGHKIQRYRIRLQMLNDGDTIIIMPNFRVNGNRAIPYDFFRIEGDTIDIIIDQPNKPFAQFSIMIIKDEEVDLSVFTSDDEFDDII